MALRPPPAARLRAPPPRSRRATRTRRGHGSRIARAEQRSRPRRTPPPLKAEDHLVTTQHHAVIGGQDHPLHRHRRHPDPARRGGEAAGVDLLHLLHPRRRQGPRASGRSPTPSTAARARPRSGCTWAPSVRAGWRWTTRGWAPPPAVPPGRQRRVAPRRHRPGVHRSGDHRLQPGHPGQGRQQVPRRRRGRRVGRRVHPPLDRRATAAGRVAEVPGRRELRHHPRRRPLRLAPEQHGIYLNGIVLLSSILNFQTARFDSRQRPALPALPADLHGDRLVPQEAAGGPPGGGVEKAVDGVRAVRRGRVHAGADAGRPARRASERNDVAAKVARYTGLSADFVKQANLRPEIQAFDKELLRDQRADRGPPRQPLQGHRPRRRRRRERVRSQLRRDPRARSPPCSTTTCARSSASRATCPTRS